MLVTLDLNGLGILAITQVYLFHMKMSITVLILFRYYSRIKPLS